MKREIYAELLNWKDSKHRMPLILRGARQVGKTYILKKFAEENFKSYIYVNFEEQKTTKTFFEGNLDPTKIISNLELHHHTKMEPNTSVIILDEIQECPEALTSLKYFNEKVPAYHVIAAGSLLGVKMGQGSGFPVGQVHFLDLYPLSFNEFLGALGEDPLREALSNITLETPLPEAIHLTCMDILKTYMLVGGLPGVVNAFLPDQDFMKAREVQDHLLKGYQADFAKHAPPTDAIKILNLWESIPQQLSKDNKKFMFNVAKSGARAREYEIALRWLIDAGLIISLPNIETPGTPLTVYKSKTIFKIYMFDTGLLGALSKLDPKILTEPNGVFTTFKGAFTENYVLQALTTCGKSNLAYWTSSGQAEVDFIYEHEGHNYPLEVKSATEKRKKSLKVYADKYHPDFLSRTSSRNLKRDNDIVNYPLYLVSTFPDLAL
ncbi:MAG: ATP-binding protein [Candidatus Margulisbacteria bacterium]|nr:ATP-binding protein [Candidatus Margulisiibacteriota bacterium]